MTVGDAALGQRGYGSWFVLAALLVCAVAVLFAVFRMQAARKMPDFEVYWRAGVRARAAEPLYREEDQHYQLKYLPPFALLAIPAGLLPLETAKAIWFMVTGVLIVALVGLSIRLLPDRRHRTWILAAGAAVVMGKFYGHELVLGQVNVLLGVLLAGATVLIRRGRERTAGVLVALAIVVKPYAIIFVPWLAARRRRRALLTALASVVIAVIAPVALYGIRETVALYFDWWRTVSTSTAPNLINQDNVSIAAMYAKWLGPGDLAWALTRATAVALIAVAAAAFAYRRQLTFPEGLECALLVTLMPLLSPQGWDYVFLVATPAVVFLVNYAGQLPRAMRTVSFVALLTIGLTLFDVLGRAAYAAFMATSLITVCFLVVTAALVSLRLRGTA